MGWVNSVPESRKKEKGCSDAPESIGGQGAKEAQGHLSAGLTWPLLQDDPQGGLCPPSRRISFLFFFFLKEFLYFYYLFIYLFIYFWLCWVFVSV